MANVKELRLRIRSVTNIAKITKAMEMVSTMKLRKVQAQALNSRPYTQEIINLGRHLADVIQDQPELPLYKPREPKVSGVFVVTSDRGLCGAYNANVLSRVHRHLAQVKAEGRAHRVYVYGTKGYSYLYRRGFKIDHFFVDPPLDKMDFDAARLVVRELVAAYTSKAIDEVRLFYTSFLSASKFTPVESVFLPVPRTTLTEKAEAGKEFDYLLEPDAATLFDLLLPKYLETVIYDAMLQSLAAEHASRRIAMKGATDAANRMRVDLRRVYNRARQESITKELLDIIGGASALA
jgi:F-type H+-transporting ATPase subunit gamma